MRRSTILAGLAIALLGAVLVTLGWRVTEVLASAAPSPAGAPPAVRSVPSDPVKTPAPSTSTARGEPRPAPAPGKSRAARRLEHQHQLRRQGVAGRGVDPLPGPDPALAQRLLQQERAAAQAAGIDWRQLERMLDGAALESDGSEASR